MIVPRVQLEYLLDTDSEISMWNIQHFLADLNVNTWVIPPDQFYFSVLQKLFIYLKILINVFNKHGWQGSKRKVLQGKLL